MKFVFTADEVTSIRAYVHWFYERGARKILAEKPGPDELVNYLPTTSSARQYFYLAVGRAQTAADAFGATIRMLEQLVQNDAHLPAPFEHIYWN